MRAWERRYRVVPPIRLENGRRSYSREDFERLWLLVRLQDQGYAIDKIASPGKAELRSILNSSKNFKIMRRNQTDSEEY